MDIQQIVQQLQAKFGNKVDVSKVTNMLQGADLSKVSIPELASKLGLNNLKDLDGDGKEEGFVEELKGKASEVLGGIGNIFHKK